MSEKDAPLAGVMGWPIAHSRSPRLHGHWLKRYGIAGWYLPLPVHPDNFEDALRAMPKLGFVGANVTIPHKEAAFALADERSPQAARIGAANTLVFDSARGIVADNTDGYGFMENLRAARPSFSAGKGPVTVLGAGGASRAVIAALLDDGASELRLANRTRARAEALRDDLDPRITVVDWADAEDAIDGAALLVNTTSMGMEGGADMTLTLEKLNAGALATDIVYTPLDTPFLMAARAKGAETVDGLGMLLHQARPGFARWFGCDPEVDQTLREIVLA